MLINYFKYVLLWSLLSIIACGIGYAAVYIFQSPEVAVQFVHSWLFKFNGLVVGGFSYGLLAFVVRHGNSVFSMFTNIVEISSDSRYNIGYVFKHISSLKTTAYRSIPLALIGALTLWGCGFPYDGLAHVYLAVCTMSIHFVGSAIFVNYILLSRMFLQLEQNIDYLSIKTDISPLHLDTFNTYFVISSIGGLLALYFSFRGTLTADFTFDSFLSREFLFYPLIVFLPLVFFYSFYPRYVLQKVRDKDISLKLESFKTKLQKAHDQNATDREVLENEKLYLELKEKLFADRTRFPVFGLKDAPSLLLSIVIVVQFLWNQDPVVKNFLDSVSKLFQ